MLLAETGTPDLRRVIMPRGKKSKARAREKRRQIQDEAHGPNDAPSKASEKGESLACSDQASGDAKPSTCTADFPQDSTPGRMWFTLTSCEDGRRSWVLVFFSRETSSATWALLLASSERGLQSRVIMPRGKKSKARAREKRRQIQDEAHGPNDAPSKASEKGESLACSDQASGDAKPSTCTADFPQGDCITGLLAYTPNKITMPRDQKSKLQGQERCHKTESVGKMKTLASDLVGSGLEMEDFKVMFPEDS
ncbi:Melanoma-associated antigen B4 [Lemmus lemmus]